MTFIPLDLLFMLNITVFLAELLQENSFMINNVNVIAQYETARYSVFFQSLSLSATV